MNSDHDEIIEDYEEVPRDKDTRRVRSAKGGPVRPSPEPKKPVGPPTKGKISRKSARNIWIVCIAVSVLGIGLFVADIAFDPFGRRKAPETPPKQQPQTKREQKKLSGKQLLAREFGVGVHRAQQEITRSRAHDFVRVALNEARVAGDEAEQSEEATPEMWKDAWLKAWRAMYATELFRHIYPYDPRVVPMAQSARDYDAFEKDMSEDELKSEKARAHTARALLYQDVEAEARRLLQRVQRAEAGSPAREAFGDEIKAAEESYYAARDRQEFAEEDLDDVNREPRGPDEPAPY